MTIVTREPQYRTDVTETLGPMTSEVWQRDPKHLVFTLARYKFVAKLLEGKDRVLEIGCGDAFGTRIVRQHVKHLTAVDFDPLFVDEAQRRQAPEWPIEIRWHDLFEHGPVPGYYDAVFALDVLEHVPPERCDEWLRLAFAPLPSNGVAVIGMPSIEGQQYASPISRAGHVNCKSGATLRSLMSRYFDNVFSFGMNDETLHTGFAPMCHYLFAVGAGRT